jgi:hypothetical protein
MIEKHGLCAACEASNSFMVGIVILFNKELDKQRNVFSVALHPGHLVGRPSVGLLECS